MAVVTPGHDLKIESLPAGEWITCSCNYPGFRLMWSTERLAAAYILHLEHVLLVNRLAITGQPAWIRGRKR